MNKFTKKRMQGKEGYTIHFSRGAVNSEIVGKLHFTLESTRNPQFHKLHQ